MNMNIYSYEDQWNACLAAVDSHFPKILEERVNSIVITELLETPGLSGFIAKRAEIQESACEWLGLYGDDGLKNTINQAFEGIKIVLSYDPETRLRLYMLITQLGCIKEGFSYGNVMTPAYWLDRDSDRFKQLSEIYSYSYLEENLKKRDQVLYPELFED